MQFLVILTAIIEVCSVAIIGPFMILASNMKNIAGNEYVNKIYILTEAKSSSQFLIMVGLVVLLTLSISTILSVITISKLSFFAARTGSEIGDTLYASYLQKNYLFHTEVNSSHLIKQIATETNRVTDNILQPFVQINARFFVVLFISVGIFIYNPLISVVGLTVLLIIYVILYIVVRKKLYANGVNISKVSKERFLLMNEGFSSIKDVLVLNRQEDFIAQFEESGQIFSQAYGSSNTLYNTPRYIMEFIVYSGMIILIISLLYFSDGDITSTIATLTVFGVAAFKILPAFQQIYSSAAQIKSNISALDEIKPDLIEARKYDNDNSLMNYSVENSDFSNSSIILKNVFFKYPNKEDYTIKQLDLIVPTRGIVGFVGASGAGKSTLLDILLGLLEPSSGEIICGNTKINLTNVRQWQSRIGYVPQNIFLKDGSILENIGFGLKKSNIDIKKANKALELAQLSEWVLGLSEGIDSEIGEKGVQISGGQKQRIGIARALYNDVDYLFFDEATSALDGKTERLIMQSIEKISKSKTIIMIAHRLDTVKKCDVIHIIDNGKIVDSGNYNFLIEHNTRFREMAGEIHDD